MEKSRLDYCYVTMGSDVEAMVSQLRSGCSISRWSGGHHAKVGVGHRAPFHAFLCSVMLSSWYGGLWSGVFAALLSVVALDYFFIPPLYAFGISLEEAPDVFVFVVPGNHASLAIKKLNQLKLWKIWSLL